MVMSVDIFILAAGEQQRWGDYPIKQLLPINGEPLILRTIRLLGGNNPIIVTHRAEIYNQVLTRCIVPCKHRWTVETLLATYLQWKSEQIIILLGDVLYSPKTLAQILPCRAKFVAFGNIQEIYALSFSDKLRVLRTLFETIKQAEDGKHLGKLRNLFHTYCGIEQKDDTKHPYFKVIDSSFNDYTNDFDCLQEYEAFLRDRIGEVKD